MLPRTTLIGLVLIVIANGCASLSKEECAGANWDAIGYRDGSTGKLASRFNTHQKACAKHGFNANFTVYKEGHQRGLNEVFCKPRNGYQLGLRGEGYNNVCPSNLERTFLPAYHYGRDIYHTQRSCNHLNQQIAKLKTELAAVETRIDQLKQEIRKDERVDPSIKARELRNERRETAALYDRIKATRHRTQQSERLKDHLRNESVEHNQRLERWVARSIKKSDIMDNERQAIHRIVRLSDEKGHLKSKINWMNSNPEIARPRHRKTANLQRQLKDFSVMINKQKSELFRHPFDLQVKRRFEHCFEQAEYAGVLQHHRNTLVHLRDPYTVNLLVDVHFDAEMENLNRRIDFARHRPPSKETLALRKKRYRELRDAQNQHRDDLYRIEELEQNMGNMQRKIERLKSARRY